MTRRFFSPIHLLLLLCLPWQAATAPAQQQAASAGTSPLPRLLRAASGPSGKTVADGVEVEFSDGRKTLLAEVLAYNATDDWALLKADTGLTNALATSASVTVRIGERLVVFNAEPQATRVIGGVDYTGRKASAKIERYVFSPALAGEAMGGPLQHPDRTKGQPAITIAANIYDADNHRRLQVQPKSVKVSKGVPTEYTFTFPTAALEPGIYRIDTLADGSCVWRTFIQIRD